MRKDLHPLVMIALVAAVTLFGRVLPTWTLSLATIAASNALIALGIVVLARTGNVSFGQGLFFAAGGYGVALIANASGSHRRGGAGDRRRGLRRPARAGDRAVDRALQRHLLRHADTGAIDGVLRRAGEIDRAWRLRRVQRRTAKPVWHELHRSARGRLHAVCRLGHRDRICRHRRDHPVPVRIRSCQPCGPRKQSAGRISRPLGQPDHIDQLP